MTSKDLPEATFESLFGKDCTSCGRSLDPDDRFCRRCGQQRGKSGPWQERPAVILALLFLGVGPLALPLLWRSPRFSKAQKAAVTVANLAFIGALTWGILWLVQRYFQFLNDLGAG